MSVTHHRQVEGGEVVVTSTAIFETMFFGSWIMLEKHSREHCDCSYCKGYKGISGHIKAVKGFTDKKRRIDFSMPKPKYWRNGWTRLSIKKGKWNYYLRFTGIKLGALIGIEFSRWGEKGNRRWRLILGQFGMLKNSIKGLLTITSHQFFKTKIPRIESLFWIDMRKKERSSGVTMKRSQ